KSGAKSGTKSGAKSEAQSAAQLGAPSTAKSGGPHAQAARASTAMPAAAAPAPVPTQPMAEGAPDVARHDNALQPARGPAAPDADASTLREAMAAAGGGRLAEAKLQRDKLSDPAARKLVDWYLYRGGYGTAAEVRAFLDANPTWPDRSLLTQRTEEALFN